MKAKNIMYRLVLKFVVIYGQVIIHIQRRHVGTQQQAIALTHENRLHRGEFRYRFLLACHGMRVGLFLPYIIPHLSRPRKRKSAADRLPNTAQVRQSNPKSPKRLQNSPKPSRPRWCARSAKEPRTRWTVWISSKYGAPSISAD